MTRAEGQRLLARHAAGTLSATERARLVEQIAIAILRSAIEGPTHDHSVGRFLELMAAGE